MCVANVHEVQLTLFFEIKVAVYIMVLGSDNIIKLYQQHIVCTISIHS